MAKRSSSSLLAPPLPLFLPGRAFIVVISLFFLLLHRLSASPNPASSHFEGFEADEDDDFATPDGNNDEVVHLLRPSPPPISLSTAESPPSPGSDPNPNPNSKSHPSTSSFDNQHWDEDEFEGIPEKVIPVAAEDQVDVESAAATETGSSENEKANLQETPEADVKAWKKLASYCVEMVCVPFLIALAVNYFTGKRENEKLALAWASMFAGKDSIFEKNFSFLGVGETEDSPLLLKEGSNVFKFYASGRRFCSGLLATMELKSRHDLISRLYNMVVPCKDEILIEVNMNDDAMDQVVFAMARKKLAKTMHKEAGDLQRFAGMVAPPNGRKWVAEELQVVSESKEVAGDLITDAVLDQVFGDKAFEKFGKGFISMHLSDQHLGSNNKILVFKFALPDANHMADMTRLVALVPYYIDLIGRYKLSSHARSKTDAARSKVAQEIYKELQLARQEALQKKKAEQRKKSEVVRAKLSAEALRKKEAKERALQMKKAMPKFKMTKSS